MFYHHNGRLSFTNGLIIVPGGEVPDGMEKTNLRNLYQMFKDTKSHEQCPCIFFIRLEHFLVFDP